MGLKEKLFQKDGYFLFGYKGVLSHGQKRKGKIVAKTKEEAVRLLTANRRNLRILKIEEELPLEFLRPITDADWRIFFHTLASYLEKGKTARDAAVLLITDNPPPSMGLFLQKFRRHLDEGRSIAESFLLAGGDPTVAQMMSTGAKSGRLPEVCYFLSNLYKRRADFNEKLKKALRGPKVAFFLLLLLSLIFPYFIKNLKKMLSVIGFSNTDLPTITKVMNALFSYYFKAFPFLVVLIFLGPPLFAWAYRTKPDFKRKVDYFLVKLPVVGGLITNTDIYKAMLELEVLYSSGVSFETALRKVIESTKNEAVRDAWKYVLEELAGRGTPFYLAIQENPFIPDSVVSFIAASAAKADYTEGFRTARELMEKALNARLEFIEETVSPTIMMAITIFVFFTIFAFYAPVFSILTKRLQ